ncbi:MAG: FISUMP domain-containing protein [bacterium]
MKNITTAGTQGVCPNGWHLPTDGEWSELTDYLGGENIAGGHLKEAGTLHWRSPNTGADNSSEFTALPSGMYFDGAFHYLRYNVEFWSSTDSHDLFAWYRILYFDQNYIYRTDYFDKNTLRSVRCLSNETTGNIEEGNNNKPENFNLEQNYPNPFNPKTRIKYGVERGGLVKISVYDLLGHEVAVLVNEQKNAGYHFTEFNADNLSSGVYLYTLQVHGYFDSKKMIVLK